MRWGVEQRMEFIEFRLYWEGGLNRADIMDHFGVSLPQASKDLSLYEEKAPSNLRYDKSEKRYLPSTAFKTVFLKPEPSQYLSQLRTVADGTVAPAETWLSWLPDADTLPIPLRRIDVQVLRDVLSAIRNRSALDIKYQSMSAARPDPEWRKISPHALAQDGLRWHVRAYCHIDHKFKDFLLSRFLTVGDSSESSIDSGSDTIWNESFAVVLCPNPALSESQRRVIAQDYEMEDGHVSVSVRKAMLYYFEKRLRLDAVQDMDSPHEAPVVIENRHAFDAALREAMA